MEQLKLPIIEGISRGLRVVELKIRLGIKMSSNIPLSRPSRIGGTPFDLVDKFEGEVVTKLKEFQKKNNLKSFFFNNHGKECLEVDQDTKQKLLSLSLPPIFYSNRINYVPQTTAYNCWAACTAMMNNSDINTVTTITENSIAKGLINPNGSATITWNEADKYGYVHYLDKKLESKPGMTIAELRTYLSVSPIMTLLKPDDLHWYSVRAYPKHWVIISAMMSDGTSLDRTCIQLYSPSGTGDWGYIWVNFQDFIDLYPNPDGSDDDALAFIKHQYKTQPVYDPPMIQYT